MKNDFLKLVSVGLSITISLVGLVAWLTAIQFNGQANTKALSSMEEKIDVVSKDMGKVKIDVALIRQAVGVKDTTQASRAPSSFLTK